MRKHSWISLSVLVVLLSVASVAFAQGKGDECTLAGTWYGGSVVAYQMTIVPAVGADQYTVTFQGMYTNAVKNTFYTGTLVKKGKRYEGAIMQLTSQDPRFGVQPPPILVMPDIATGWVSMKLEDCNTISNVLPFMGYYFADSVWTGLKVPMIDPPDLDMVVILNGGKPVLETYHRLPNSMNPALMH